MIEQAVKEMLTEDEDVYDFVEDRIRPLIVAQNDKRPYLTYQVVTAEPINHFSGTASYSRATVEIGLFADSLKQLLLMGKEVKRVLNGVARTTDTVRIAPSLFEDESVYFSGDFNPIELTYHNHPDLPQYGRTNPSDPNTWCSNVQGKLHDDDGGKGEGTAVWEVDFTMKSITYDPDPFNRPARIEGGGSGITETPLKDINGDPLCNSAGDLYQGIPEIPVRGITINITRNERNNPASRSAQYSYTTNSGALWGRPAESMYFGEITWTNATEVFNGIKFDYWVVTYPICIRQNEGDWRLKVLDSGYRRLNSDDEPTVANDDVGQAPLVPVWLDGNGGVLPPGGTKVIYPTDGFELVHKTSWGSLGLPNPFAN